jgi:hypothetical protein
MRPPIMIKWRIVRDPQLKSLSLARPPTEKQMQKGFKPYATELGMLVYSWNRLQKALGDLFCLVCGDGNRDIPRAAWNAVTNDRLQRQMLLAAALASKSIPTKGKEEVKWIVDRAEEFEDRRNNAIHTPFEFSTGPEMKGFVLGPAWYSGHPRAIKMRGKDLFDEFRWYGETATVLARYARDLFWPLLTNDRPMHPNTWPQRPQLPRLGRSATRKGTSRRARTKSTSPPRASSQE